VDGIGALPDEAITRRANGVQLGSPGIQHEAGNANNGSERIDCSDTGVMYLVRQFPANDQSGNSEIKNLPDKRFYFEFLHSLSQ